MMPQQTTLHQPSFLKRIPLPFLLPTGVYGAMLMIWHLRVELQQLFPLHKGKPRDYVRFLAWCATVGRREYKILCSIPEWDEELGRRIALPQLYGDRWQDGYSVLMFFYGVAHSHYTFSTILKSAELRDQLAIAFWRGERHAHQAPWIQEWQGEYLRRKHASLDDFITSIRLSAHDRKKRNSLLYKRFRLSDLVDWKGLEQETTGSEHVAHLPGSLMRLAIRLPNRFLQAATAVESMSRRVSEFQLSTVTRLIPTVWHTSTKPIGLFGVNLYGYARGELGIGEDVRLVAAALETQGIPFCIVNVEPGKDISQEDDSVEHWISNKPLYAINLFCLTGVELARFICEKGAEFLAGRYTIGLSPWELPHWPASCQYTYGSVDELWGISNYTAQAYTGTPHPVQAMSLPVTIGEVPDLRRADFGLPEKPYLFVFAFDINSSVARKNPEGVIRAFQKAFPREGTDEVGLVIKVNMPESDPGSLGFLRKLDPSPTKQQQWNAVKRVALGDPRIRFIEQGLRRPQVMALYRSCDCYVSLHRAEGFGRCLAEALLLGKQLIATGFSGNMDFCREPRVALVNYRLRPVRSGEYFWSDGQMWAEPDIDHAAELMRDVRSNPRATHSLHPDFSPLTVGARYARRLREIQEEFDLEWG